MLRQTWFFIHLFALHFELMNSFYLPLGQKTERWALLRAGSDAQIQNTKVLFNHSANFFTTKHYRGTLPIEFRGDVIESKWVHAKSNTK